MSTEQLDVALQVIDVLDNLNVPYLIGGSLAAAVHGVARATLDADLIADLDLPHAEPFAQALAGAFYLDLETIRQAIRNRSSFNLIHLTTMFKIDIFVSRRRSFDQARFAQRLKFT
jgi:hypothetical protein